MIAAGRCRAVKRAIGTDGQTCLGIGAVGAAFLEFVDHAVLAGLRHLEDNTRTAAYAAGCLFRCSIQIALAVDDQLACRIGAVI